MPWVCVQSKWSSKQFPLLKLLCKRIVWLGLSMLEQLANRTFSNPWQRDNLIASSLPRDLSYRNPAGFRTLWTHYLLSGFIFAFAQKYILRLLNRKDPMSSVEEKFAATWWDLVDCSNNSWHLRPMRFHTGPWVNVHPVIGHNIQIESQKHKLHTFHLIILAVRHSKCTLAFKNASNEALQRTHFFRGEAPHDAIPCPNKAI